MTNEPNSISVRLFAAARDKAGTDLVTLQMSLPTTIAEIRSALVESVPALCAIAPHLLFAVGTEYVRDEGVVQEPIEIVAFPPVSGG